MPDFHVPDFALPAPSNSKEIVRVSISCLCRLFYNNKYILIINNDGNKYQPIGGCYHYKEEARKKLQDEFGFNTDKERWPETDLRGRLPHCNLNNFIRWFNHNNERESTSSCGKRELEEELTSRKLFNLSKFAKVSDLNYLWYSIEPLSFELKWDCEVTRYFHVIDIISPHDFLWELHNEGIKENVLFLATEDEIKNSKGIIRGKQVSLHAIHLVKNRVL